MGGTGAGEPEPGATGSPPCSMLLLSMNDFANFKQIGKGKDCVVYSASCEKLGGTSVVLKVSCWCCCTKGGGGAHPDDVSTLATPPQASSRADLGATLLQPAGV